VPEIEKKIALGVEMLGLRSTTDCNRKFGRLRAARFDVDAQQAAEMIRVAKVYSEKPEIFRHVSWRILCELTSAAVHPDARHDLESRIMRGEKIEVAQIRRARGPVKLVARFTQIAG
jgi:hypothetical protein